MLKIGDTVRFLNAVGGGKIVKIDTAAKLVYVEDEDGFEIPVLPQECVVVNNIKHNNFPNREAETEKQTDIRPSAKANPPEETPAYIQETPVHETKDGDIPKTFLAFVPENIKTLQTTNYECVLVNDSNYYLAYNLVSIQDGKFHSLAAGWLEPNMQDVLADVAKTELNTWENLRMQVIFFKKNKAYPSQAVLDLDLKLDLVKFYKLHCFTESDYFDEPAMLIDLQSRRNDMRMEQISGAEIREAMIQKEQPIRKKHPQPKPASNNMLEVDLHINQLLDTTAGMSNADILAYQMDVFHKTLAENARFKGKKIVFIHGKGEGVLRKEIEQALKKRYPHYTFQDASFKEYGFGATMVTIH